MFFKPNFCCNCGERIQRAQWKLTTSRRFCDVCAIENQGHEWFPRAVVGVSVIAALLGLGTYLSRPSVPSQPMAFRVTGPSAVTREPSFQAPATLPGSGENGAGIGTQPLETREVTAPQGAAISSAAATREQPRIKPGASDEPVYFCGAMTRKGKPCSRRVKARGRCWQHIGQPSALESKQLPVEN